MALSIDEDSTRDSTTASSIAIPDDVDIFTPTSTDFMNVVKLAWADKENHDLQEKNDELHMQVEQVRAENEELKGNMARPTATLAASGPLKDECTQLQKEFEDLKSEIAQIELQRAMDKMSLKSEEESQRIRADKDDKLRQTQIENKTLKEKIGTLSTELNAVKSKNEEHHSRISRQMEEIADLMIETDKLYAENRHLKASFTSHNHDIGPKMDSLLDSVDRILKEKDDDKKNSRCLSLENDSLSEKIVRLEADVGKKNNECSYLLGQVRLQQQQQAMDYEGNINHIRKENDWLCQQQLEATHKKDEVETKLKTELNSFKTSEMRLRLQVIRMQNEIMDLHNPKTNVQDEVSSLKASSPSASQLKELKANIAYHVSQIDLMREDIRVFTCNHNALESIPDRNNHTRKKHIDLIVQDIWKDWRNDGEFTRAYGLTRQYILDHHRAHERVYQGRGTYSTHIQQIFIKQDQSRSIDIRYT